MSSPQPSLGIIGAGKLGMVLAQLALRAGYQVYIAGSGDPDKIALSVKIITPGAIATTVSSTIEKADIVILALPLSEYQTLPKQALSGKLVIDSMNYWWEVDGEMPHLDTAASSSQMIQDYLSEARLVKALSHMGYHNLLDDSRPRGEGDRKAIAISGDDSSDNDLVSSLVDNLGFDPVVIGGLGAGKYLEPGQPLFGASVSKDELKSMIQLPIDT